MSLGYICTWLPIEQDLICLLSTICVQNSYQLCFSLYTNNFLPVMLTDMTFDFVKNHTLCIHKVRLQVWDLIFIDIMDCRLGIVYFFMLEGFTFLSKNNWKRILKEKSLLQKFLIIIYNGIWILKNFIKRVYTNIY
jgi:hypothetical protein